MFLKDGENSVLEERLKIVEKYLIKDEVYKEILTVLKKHAGKYYIYSSAVENYLGYFKSFNDFDLHTNDVNVFIDFYKIYYNFLTKTKDDLMNNDDDKNHQFTYCSTFYQHLLHFLNLSKNL